MLEQFFSRKGFVCMEFLSTFAPRSWLSGLFFSVLGYFDFVVRGLVFCDIFQNKFASSEIVLTFAVPNERGSAGAMPAGD